MRIRLFAAVAATAAALLLAGCSTNTAPTSQPTSEATTDAPSTAPSPETVPDECVYATGGAAARKVTAPPASPELSGDVTAVVETSAGTITLSLTADRTPCTVSSFVSLATQGFYDDIDCHRLTLAGIYVLQCGDPTGTGSGTPGYRYADELDGSETYPAGTIAMANAGPNTNGSQFFLVYEDSPLPPSYTVFGTIDDAGVEILRAIAAKGTANGQPDGAPMDPVTIASITFE